DIAAVLRFADGSVANLVYTASGTTSYAKERLEVFCGGNVYVLDDFRRLTVRGSKRLDLANRSGGKGHAAELAELSPALKGRPELPLAPAAGLLTRLASLAICESARSGRAAEPVAIRTV